MKKFILLLPALLVLPFMTAEAKIFCPQQISCTVVSTDQSPTACTGASPELWKFNTFASSGSFQFVGNLPLHFINAQSGPEGSFCNYSYRVVGMGFYNLRMFSPGLTALTSSKNQWLSTGSVNTCFGNDLRDMQINNSHDCPFK